MERNGDKHLYKIYATPVEVLKEKGELVGFFCRIIGWQENFILKNRDTGCMLLKL